MKKAIVVFLRPGARWNPEKTVREQSHWMDHARFMDALCTAGKVMLAGPFADEGAMVILNVESIETARTIFQDDPWAHHDILITAEVREWIVVLDGRDNAPVSVKNQR